MKSFIWKIILLLSASLSFAQPLPISISGSRTWTNDSSFLLPFPNPLFTVRINNLIVTNLVIVTSATNQGQTGPGFWSIDASGGQGLGTFGSGLSYNPTTKVLTSNGGSGGVSVQAGTNILILTNGFVLTISGVTDTNAVNGLLSAVTNGAILNISNYVAIVSQNATNNDISVAAGNGITATTNSRVVTMAANLVAGANVTLSTNGGQISISSSGGSGGGIATINGFGTNTTVVNGFQITNTANNSFFFVGSNYWGMGLTNGISIAWTNGILYSAGGTNTTWSSNLVVTGWSAISNSLSALNFSTPTNTATSNYVLVATSAGANPTTAWEVQSGGSLPLGTNSGDMLTYHGSNWIVQPVGQYLLTATSTNAAITNLSTFVTGKQYVAVPTGWSVVVKGVFEFAGSTNGHSGAWSKSALFRNDAGSLSLLWSNQTEAASTTWSTNWNCQYAVSGTNIVFQGVGDTNETVSMYWQGQVRFLTNATQAAAPSIAWNGQISANKLTVSGTSGTMTVTNGAAQGSTVSVVAGWKNTSSGLVNGVSDARGNSYSINYYTNDGSGLGIVGFSSKLATALQPGDTITVTFSASATYFATFWAGQILNSSAADVSGTNAIFATSTHCNATTTSTPEIVTGVLLSDAGTKTWTVGNFTLISTMTNGDGSILYFQESTLSGAGAKDMAGTLSGGNTYAAGMTCFK